MEGGTVTNFSRISWKLHHHPKSWRYACWLKQARASKEGPGIATQILPVWMLTQRLQLAPGLPSGPLPGKLPSDSRQHPAVVINSEGNSSRNTGQSIQECPRQPTKAAERMSLLGMPGSLVAYDFTSAKGAFLLTMPAWRCVNLDCRVSVC